MKLKKIKVNALNQKIAQMERDFLIRDTSVSIHFLMISLFINSINSIPISLLSKGKDCNKKSPFERSFILDAALSRYEIKGKVSYASQSPDLA